MTCDDTERRVWCREQCISQNAGIPSSREEAETNRSVCLRMPQKERQEEKLPSARPYVGEVGQLFLENLDKEKTTIYQRKNVDSAECQTCTPGERTIPETTAELDQNEYVTRINIINTGLEESKKCLENIMKQLNIPIRQRSTDLQPLRRKQANKVRKKKGNHSTFIVTLTDGNQSLRLEPKTRKGHKKHTRSSADTKLLKKLKLSMKTSKHWSVLHDDCEKERKKRKRKKDRKVKSNILKSLKRNWNNTKVSENKVNNNRKNISRHSSVLRDLVTTWRTQPEKLYIHVYPVYGRSLDTYFQSLEDGNSSVQQSAMNFEWMRLNSFASVSREIQVRPIVLARDGFYYTGQEDQVRCYSCGATHKNWRADDDVCRFHRTKSPNCRHIVGNDETNVPIAREERTNTNELAANTREGITQTRLHEEGSYPGQAANGSIRDHLEPSVHQHNGREHEQLEAHSTVVQPQGNVFLNQQRELPIVRAPDNTPQVQPLRLLGGQEVSSPRGNESLTIAQTTNRETRQNHPSQQSSNTVRRNAQPLGLLGGQEVSSPRGNESLTIAPTTNTETRQNHPSQQSSNAVRHNAHINNNTHRANNVETGRGLPSSYHEQSQSHRPNSSTSDISSSTINKLAPLGVNFDKPKYPAYAVITVRMSSYSGWKASQTPKEMSEAGFVYAGYADYTRCFFCGGGLKNWEEGDDPWVEHARWFPKCAYLRQNKGDVFIKLVHDRLQQMNQGENQQSPQTTTRANGAGQGQGNNGDVQYLPAYQSLLENGYDHNLIISAITNLRTNNAPIIDAISIAEEIHRLEDADFKATKIDEGQSKDKLTVNGNVSGNDNEDEEEMKELSTLMEENRRLKRQKYCRICEDEDATIAFLPCSHLVCCNICSQAVRRCPLCGEPVQGTVKTWIV